MADKRSKRVGRAALWLAGVSLAAADAAQAAAVTAAVESVRPGRPHLVAAGTPTTFVLSLTNGSPVDREVTVRIDSSADSSSVLRRADELFAPVSVGASEVRVVVKAESREHVLAWITPTLGLPAGQQGRTSVSAREGAEPLGVFGLDWKVSLRPKLYYVVLDGCGAGYLRLDRRGQPLADTHARGWRRQPPWSRGPLMPRALEFLQGAAWFTAARSVLPAITDPNHMSALTGSWPGTIGIHSVRSYYGGRDDEGRPVSLGGSKELLRTGMDGEPIRSVFDVAKDAQAGGSPDVFSILLTGKSWLGALVRDEAATVDIIASGKEFPAYVPPPEKVRLGDPASDPNAESDREGTNIGPRFLLKKYSVPAAIVSQNPGRSPEDRWVAGAAVRMIMAEDPDFTYVVLAETDTVQHVFGAADRPEEWTDPSGTPNILWDDVNVFNPHANRDPVLDVVHEADYSFGRILDALRARGTLERSFVVMLSDHGQITEMKSSLNVGQILASKAVPSEDIERIISSGEVASIYLTDPARAAVIEPLLEAHEELHPVTGQAVRPFLVLSRKEMDSGIDTLTGEITADGLSGNRRGEVYSEWSIDGPPTEQPRVRWPDLFLLNRHHFQNKLARSDDLDGGDYGSIGNGHHGSPQSSEIPLALSGPGIAQGVYDVPATLADILPTLYPLLGLQPPAHVDGRPLAPALVGGSHGAQ